MHQKRKILITDHVHPILLNGLEGLGFGCDYQPKILTHQVKPIIGQYSGLIINSKILVDRSMLDQAHLLRFVGRLGSGMEIVNIDYATSKGIAILRTPEGNCDAVAEHVIGMMLAFGNNLMKADSEVRQMVWNREANRGFELMDKTIGIIGFGYTGSALARKLAGFNVRVLAYDKYLKDYANDLPWVEEVEMEQLFRESDLLSLHLPLTEETRHLVDENFLQSFEKKILLVNTSRGPIIRTTDLIRALENEAITGACLDVFENEKPATYSEQEKALYSRLFEMKNVLLSPHVAGWTHASFKRHSTLLLEKISAVLTGQNS